MENMNKDVKTVLIVDDEQAIIDVLKFNLLKEGYRTIEAKDGQTGLEMALKERPNLIMLDIMLPKMDGLTVCQRVKSVVNIPIVILTAKDEEVDNLHSYYVDQWDWERVIEKEDRNITTLKNHVKKIFKVIKHMEHEVWYKYPHVVNRLPDRVHFITAQELENQYPDLAAKERENKICKEFGCVFVMQIGNVLQSGQKHDGRAPDYDDWKLNGDLLFWYEPLQCALEISSMGIRVDEDSLVEQLKKENCEDRLNLPYHRAIINKELPYTIGGGIGQSRLCMLLLNRAHIGEVQASIWPQEMIDECEKNNIHLL